MRHPGFCIQAAVTSRGVSTDLFCDRFCVFWAFLRPRYDSRLAEHLTAANAAVSGLIQKVANSSALALGGDPIRGHAVALKRLWSLTWREAQVQTYADIFLGVALCFAIATLLVPLMRRPGAAAPLPVDAALAGLDLGEVVTIPPLQDGAAWESYNAARLALAPQLSRSQAAPRYQQAMTR